MAISVTDVTNNNKPNLLERIIIDVYMFLSSFRIVGALGGYLVAYWLLPWVRDLVPLPSVLVVIMSMGVGYVIGSRLDHHLRVPWQPLLRSPLWAHDAPVLAIVPSLSDDVVMLQQWNGEKRVVIFRSMAFHKNDT